MKFAITIDDSGRFDKTRKISLSKDQILAFIDYWFCGVDEPLIPDDDNLLPQMLEDIGLMNEIFRHYMDDCEVSENLHLNVSFSTTYCSLIEE